ncbi:MAG TPA: hypothetical protein PKA31_02255 [Candidatus Moranbacteria bacterium]|nr:hypothetical protein [Candidatus Moranbacteria bacterium]
MNYKVYGGENAAPTVADFFGQLRDIHEKFFGNLSRFIFTDTCSEVCDSEGRSAPYVELCHEEGEEDSVRRLGEIITQDTILDVRIPVSLITCIRSKNRE